ncbi:MAG: ABC transporter ATP-binding protein [Candidatus Rokubacteria bacterium]|nr:ABC transporter ATP-binding protein [Candidatus Rokubacteria bacterium]
MTRVAAEIRIGDLVKTFGLAPSALTVIDGVSFEAAPNEFVAVVGPSGCGKSTILRLVAGLERPDGGAVTIEGTEPDPRRHRIGFVFQGDSLLPWRTIEQNIALGLENAAVTATERHSRARGLVGLVGLEGFERYFPYQVSGGMRQRAAVARAFAIDPEVLLMDEPFGSLDVQMRKALQIELLRVWERLKTTVLFVTHDVEEAVILADRIVVLTPRPAHISDVIGVPLARPRDPLAADFLEIRRRLEGLLHGD